MIEETKKCPYCAEEIKLEAIKCKHCGEILDSRLKTSRENNMQNSGQKIQKWSPGVAALLSFLIPGAGQIYKGDVIIGIVWLISVIIGYSLLIVPGIILHLICIFSASSGDPYR